MTRDEYVRNVGWWLRDLPWSTRRDLLAELRATWTSFRRHRSRAQLGPPEDVRRRPPRGRGPRAPRGVVAFLRARRPRNLILFVLALTVDRARDRRRRLDRQLPADRVRRRPPKYPPEREGRPPGRPACTVVFRKGRPFDVRHHDSEHRPLHGADARRPAVCDGLLLGSPADVHGPEPAAERDGRSSPSVPST